MLRKNIWLVSAVLMLKNHNFLTVNYLQTGSATMSEPTMENRLAQIRTESGISQKTLAIALNVDPSTLSKYESGVLDIPSGRLITSCEELDVTPNDILGYPKLSPEEEKEAENAKIQTGRYLSQLMETRKVSERKLSQMINRPVCYISRVETGRYGLSAEAAGNIIRALHLSGKEKHMLYDLAAASSRSIPRDIADCICQSKQLRLLIRAVADHPQKEMMIFRLVKYAVTITLIDKNDLPDDKSENPPSKAGYTDP